jgi:lactate permease
MNLLAITLAIAPILLILILLAVGHLAADIAGALGWVVTVLIAWLFFKTHLMVIFQASLAGLVASLPIAMVVAASILQVTLMIETGAIDRVVVLIKTVSPSNQIVQIMLINIGFGTLLTALGAVPVSILPPIMLAMGYSVFSAIALPAIGYDALTTYALLGIPVVVFSNFVGQPVEMVAGHFARFMPVISSCIAIGMLYIVGKWKMVWQGLVPALLAGLTAGFIAIGMARIRMITTTGIAAGLGVILVMLVYLKLTGQTVFDPTRLDKKDRAVKTRQSIWAAISPWIILTLISLLVNTPLLPFFNLTFKQWAMPVEIIPGAPEKIRLFWQAYFWILVSTGLALPILKPTRAQMSTTLHKWLKRAPRPVLAAMVFFAIAFVLNNSGMGPDWQLTDPSRNMVQVLAEAAAVTFGKLYPMAAPFLGLMGGFISGSETSSIAMLTALHLSTAEKVEAVGVLIAAASGIGGGLASVISPAKLQNASAAIDRIGEEAKVLRATFPIALAITAVCAIMALIWAF